jgi:RNA polymerase sigma factor (sigma-70 family)
MNTNAVIRERQREISEIHSALEQLNEDERNLIEMRYSDILSYDQIGKFLTLSTSTVSRHLNKVTERVHMLLCQEYKNGYGADNPG